MEDKRERKKQRKRDGAQENRGGRKLFLGEKRLPAIYTLESTYVVPIILLILFTVILYAFYLHDILLTDAWAAHLAEEGRMAVTYRRIPFSASIYADGFEDEDSLDLCSLILRENVDNAGENLMTGELSLDEIVLKEKESFVCMKTVSGNFVLNSEESKKHAEYVEQTRVNSDAREIARITTAVFRTVRELTE